MSILAAAERSRPRRMAAPVAALGGTAVAWALVTVLRPGDSGPTPCAFRTLTGLDCPFCGSTRAASCLGSGDVVGALDHNAWFVVVLLPLAAGLWAVWAQRSWRGEPAPVIPNRLVLAVVALTVVWWVVRLAVPWLRSGIG
jgi:hypothetical protein